MPLSIFHLNCILMLMIKINIKSLIFNFTCKKLEQRAIPPKENNLQKYLYCFIRCDLDMIMKDNSIMKTLIQLLLHV